MYEDFYLKIDIDEFISDYKKEPFGFKKIILAFYDPSSDPDNIKEEAFTELETAKNNLYKIYNLLKKYIFVKKGDYKINFRKNYKENYIFKTPSSVLLKLTIKTAEKNKLTKIMSLKEIDKVLSTIPFCDNYLKKLDNIILENLKK